MVGSQVGLGVINCLGICRHHCTYIVDQHIELLLLFQKAFGNGSVGFGIRQGQLLHQHLGLLCIGSYFSDTNLPLQYISAGKVYSGSSAGELSGHLLANDHFGSSDHHYLPRKLHVCSPNSTSKEFPDG